MRLVLRVRRMQEAFGNGEGDGGAQECEVNHDLPEDEVGNVLVVSLVRRFADFDKALEQVDSRDADE